MIRELLNKIACKHEWQPVSKLTVETGKYSGWDYVQKKNDEIPSEFRFPFKYVTCKKCWIVKKVKK